jgi:hypothetical protein
MKLSTIAYVIYILLIASLLFIISHPVSLIAQEIDIPIKTIDSEINRLSIKYSVDKKLAMSIINCESQFKGNAVNHNKLDDGTIWSTDKGLWQINDYFHKETMSKLGLDINNQFDSLEYGFILFKSQGVSPWSASSKCWAK